MSLIDELNKIRIALRTPTGEGRVALFARCLVDENNRVVARCVSGNLVDEAGNSLVIETEAAWSSITGKPSSFASTIVLVDGLTDALSGKVESTTFLALSNTVSTHGTQIASLQTTAAGLGNSSTRNVGTTTSTVAAGDDARLTSVQNFTTGTTIPVTISARYSVVRIAADTEGPIDVNLTGGTVGDQLEIMLFGFSDGSNFSLNESSISFYSRTLTGSDSVSIKFQRGAGQWVLHSEVVNGLLAIDFGVGTGAPTDAVNPVTWVDVEADGVAYKLPLYQ